MGTRHLVVVKLDGEYKVAQYGQFDGYPSGTGVKVLQLLKTTPRKTFEAKLRRCRWATDTELAAGYKLTGDALDAFNKAHANWHRSVRADIIRLIYDSEDGLVLVNHLDFAADSLFCEWAYVVDMDEDTFEVYKGFNKTKLGDLDRFHYLTGSRAKVNPADDYQPVLLLRTYPLQALPTDAKLIQDCSPDSDE